MGIYNEIDMKVDPSGDLVIGANKDFKLIDPPGALKQDIIFRARTEKDDFEVHPDAGANLQALIGEQNTRENALIAEKKLFTSLTKDGRVHEQDLSIKAVPISMENLVLYTFVNASNYDVEIFTAAVLDYKNGVLYAPEGGE